MGFKLTTTTLAATAAMIFGLLVFMVAPGGLVLLVSLVVSAATLVALPVLWLTGRRRRARQLLTAWGVYLALYLTIATGITLAGAVSRTQPHHWRRDLCGLGLFRRGQGRYSRLRTGHLVHALLVSLK